jgi:hypothetical protein
VVSPWAREEIVRPRLQSGVVVRPLNFTVRGHLRLRINDNWIEGDGVLFRGSYPVLEASLIGDRVVVVYDWMAFDRAGPARNLFCYDRSGRMLWRAADIGQGRVDAYTRVITEEPLSVGNFVGASCRINEQTGQVVDTCFTK